VKFSMPRFRCRYPDCQHEWSPRKAKLSERCPACDRRDWADISQLGAAVKVEVAPSDRETIAAALAVLQRYEGVLAAV
jgi:hypothetical protein